MSEPKDLIALVADSHQQRTLEVLLAERRSALRLRPITFDLFVHPESDPGVFRQAHAFLRGFKKSYRYALVMLDVRFPGSPGSRSEIESKLQSRLDQSNWSGCSAVIAIDPELEAWVWSDSPHVARILGQPMDMVRKIAKDHDWWSIDTVKPSEPKALLREVLRFTRKPPSAAVFGELAKSVSVTRCADPAFRSLRDLLSAWFGT